MTTTPLAMMMAVLLATEAPHAEGAAAPAAGHSGEMRPPPGSPEDQALWRAGVDVAPRIGRAKLRANKLQWEALRARHLDSLEALAKSDSPDAARAAELLEGYRAALVFNHATLSRQWPVDPTRGCSYPVLDLVGALEAQEHRRKAAQVTLAREDLRDCIDRANPAIQVMTESNDELAKLTLEVVALLTPRPGGASHRPAGFAEPAACRGTLSGSVQGAFECTVRVVAHGGSVYLSFDPITPIDGVPSYVPGSFEIAPELEARAYTLDTVAAGRASVAKDGGSLFTATRTFSQRGEIMLDLANVKKLPDGGYAVSGTYRARLLAVGGGDTGEVIVDVKF